MEATEKERCEFESRPYSHGSEIDYLDTKMICIDGTWVDKETLESVGC